MYRIRLAIVAFLLATIGLQAQEGFYYQAVIKNTDGSPLKETPVKIRIQILEEGNETPEYQEVREITTSREGFISFIIGENASEDFTAINWQGELYLQDEIDTGEGYGAPTRMPLLKTPRSYISDRAISVLDNSITSASILDGSILSDDLSDQSVLTAKLADSLITSTKIARSAVTNTAIASNAISTDNVIDSTLTNADISPDAAIDFSKINIPDGSITLEKVNLEDGSIAYSKLIVDEGEIPYSKILVEDNDIAFEKLNITKENINDLGIISNYEGGSNITITDASSIDLDDEISLSKVTSNLIGDVLNADGNPILVNGDDETTAEFTGKLNGDIYTPDGTRRILSSANNFATLIGGITNREGTIEFDVEGGTIKNSSGTVLDVENGIFNGLVNGTIVGNWSGNISGITVNGETDYTILERGNPSKYRGDIYSIITEDTPADYADEAILSSGDGSTSAEFRGNVLSGNGTLVLDNGDDGSDATFTGNVVGNADSATTLSATLSIEKGGTGATTAADARLNLELENVDNTADADKPISTATQSALDLKAPLDNPTFTGTVQGITSAMVGLENVDNTADADKPISTATQSALDLKAPLDNPTFTGTVQGITSAMVGLENVDNTADADKPISTATQSALDLKAPLDNPTFTGTVQGITSAMVGLENVNNTADTDKPISTATQTALDLKAPLDNPTFTGTTFISKISLDKERLSIQQQDNSLTSVLLDNGTSVDAIPIDSPSGQITLKNAESKVYISSDLISSSSLIFLSWADEISSDPRTLSSSIIQNGILLIRSHTPVNSNTKINFMIIQ